MVLFAIWAMPACDASKPIYRDHPTKNMTHISTEYVDDNQTIDIYRDTLNNNVCYVYHDLHYGNTTISCVKDEMAFTR